MPAHSNFFKQTNMIKAFPNANIINNDPKSHFLWIDILRGLSAFGVVLHHVRVDLWVGWKAMRDTPSAYSAFDHISSWLSVLTPFLGSAVMLFFLISGFCVHYPYAQGRALQLPSYAIRRFLRIYPPYIAALLLSIGVEFLLHGAYQKPASSFLKILQSVFMVQNYGFTAGQIQSNPSLWSLPVEVELYIAYPVFLWVSLRFGWRVSMLLASVVSAAALTFSLRSDASSSWYYPSASFAIYWIIWCSGAALGAMAARGKIMRWHPLFWPITAFFLCAAIVFQTRGASQGFQHLTWAAFYFFVVLWGLNNTTYLHLPQFLKRLLITLGLMSYSLYLIHFPFFRLCGVIWFETFGSKPSNFLIPLCFSVICLPIAYAFFKFIELPSHNYAKALGRKTPVGH